MEYLLKSSGLVLLFVVFYNLFLKNETFFTSIRSYFIIGLVIIITIPLIEIPIYVSKASNQLNTFNLINLESNSSQIKNTLNWKFIVYIIYSFGILFFTVKFISQLISLAYLFANHKKIKKGNIIFIETSKNIAPFSFFNIIIYNKEHFTEEELEQIIKHEKVHVKQWHSVDTILTHLLAILLWFNPFAWYLKKLSQQNLEYLTDSNSIKNSKNQQLYKFTLLKASTTNFNLSIANNFYKSLIKKRINMLHKNPSQKNKQWKYALLLPILIAFIGTFNTKTIAQEKYAWEINTNVIDLIFDKNTSDSELNLHSKEFKEVFNIDLSFKRIKRNTNKEITAIKIEAKKSSNSTLFMRQSEKPIKPIIISYDSQKDEISIGNIQEEELNFTTEFKNNKIDTLNTNKAIFISSDGKKTEFSIEEDNASENVYIFKTDTKSDQKYLVPKKENVTVITTNSEKPIYILDGKEINSDEMEKIKPAEIEQINVLKDKNATDKYGKKGINGVIEITLKKK